MDLTWVVAHDMMHLYFEVIGKEKFLRSSI